MKKNFVGILLMLLVAVSLSSCGTLFTSSKQEVTFRGTPGSDIYNKKNERVGEITKNGFVSVPVRKKLSSQTFVVQKEGYNPRTVTVKSKFNPISLINFIAPIPWVIDIATGKVCKYSSETIDATLIPVSTKSTSDETPAVQVSGYEEEVY